MSLVDELYKEVILDHYRHPRNRGTLADATLVVQGSNPLCGDEIELGLRLAGDRIEAVAFTGRGCSISQASASMMTEVIKGRTLAEAAAILETFKGVMLRNEPAERLEDLGDLEALQGVKRFPVRIKCAILAWNTLQEALTLVRERLDQG